LATYYVKTGGNDSSAGTSDGTAWARHPWMSTWTGSVTLTAGDTVCMNRGDTWSISTPAAPYITIAQSGTNGSPITTTAYGTGAKPIINIATDSAQPVIVGLGKSYITFDNLEIAHFDEVQDTANGQDGIRIGKDASLNVSHDWIITNCTIHEIPSVAIYGYDDSYNIYIGDINATSTATNTLFSNEIYNVGYGAIYLSGRNPSTNRSDFYVYYNYVHDIDDANTGSDHYSIVFSMNTEGTDQWESDGWPEYCYARYNYIEDNKYGDALDTHGGQHQYFLNNKIYNCVMGIDVAAADRVGRSAPILNYCYIENNIIEAPGNALSGSFNFIFANAENNSYRVTNLYIRYNECYYTSRPTSETTAIGILVTGMSGATIEGNNIYNGPTGSTTFGIGISSSYLSKNVTIKNNYVSNWANSILISAAAIDGLVEIYNNIAISDIGQICTMNNGTLGGNLNVYNNTFLINSGSLDDEVLNFQGSTSIGSGVTINIKNNIFGYTATNSNGVYIRTPDTFTGTFVCNYNQYWGSSLSTPFNRLTSWTNWATWTDTHSYDLNSPNYSHGDADYNPLFINATSGYTLDTDFQIQTGSPAKNAGTNVGVVSDYFGNYRYAGMIDIGVHEYGSSPLYDRQYVEYTDGIDIFRDGVRNNYYVIDKELNSFMGFDGTEDVDWENIYLIS
jgi:hypothetical protein